MEVKNGGRRKADDVFAAECVGIVRLYPKNEMDIADKLLLRSVNRTAIPLPGVMVVSCGSSTGQLLYESGVIEPLLQ